MYGLLFMGNSTPFGEMSLIGAVKKCRISPRVIAVVRLSDGKYVYIQESLRDSIGCCR